MQDWQKYRNIEVSKSNEFFAVQLPLIILFNNCVEMGLGIRHANNKLTTLCQSPITTRNSLLRHPADKSLDTIYADFS